LLRKLLTIVILVPLGVLIVAFAVANRAAVTVSFDPFSPGEPAATVTLPLFVLIIVLLVVGVLIGGTASWIRQGKWRSSVRRLDRDLIRLRGKLAAFEAAGPNTAIRPEPAEPGQPLRLKPPAR
jgi:uncharacterized integral membrane protein